MGKRWKGDKALREAEECILCYDSGILVIERLKSKLITQQPELIKLMKNSLSLGEIVFDSSLKKRHEKK